MTKIHNLRSFIQVLEEAGQLVRVTKPVSLTYELADVAATLVRNGGGAPLFENVEGSEYPIFAAGVANQKRAALALGCEESDVTDLMGRVLKPGYGIAPIRVDEAGWKANVQTGEAIDVRQLPIPTHSRGDGGAFITGGVIVSQDPISGRGNLSYNRMLRTGPRNFGFNVNEWRHVRTFMESRDEPAAPFPVAVAIGLDPAIMIGAGVRTEADELTIAGAIRGKGAFGRFKNIVFGGRNVELKHQWSWFETRRKRERIEDWLRSCQIEPQWTCDIFAPPPLPDRRDDYSGPSSSSS